jgi:hypothetical protein
MGIFNKPTGVLAHAHITRVANTFQHLSKEAYEVSQAKLPTLYVLPYIQNIPGAELEHIPNLQAPNHIAASLRTTTKEVDENRASRREHIPTNLHPKDYARKLRNQCQPLKYSDRLLKHMILLWEEEVRDRKPILEKQTSPAGSTHIYILNATTIHAKLHSGDKQRPNNNLELALSTLKATLTLPASHENGKLLKATTTRPQIIHTSWHQYIDHEGIPTTNSSSYETITTHIYLDRGLIKHKKRHSNRISNMTPSEIIHTHTAS